MFGIFAPPLNSVYSVNNVKQLYKTIENAKHFRESQKPLVFDTFGSDITFDEISSIKAAGEQHVYDLSIEGTWNFIANDIAAHILIWQLLQATSAFLLHQLQTLKLLELRT